MVGYFAYLENRHIEIGVYSLTLRIDNDFPGYLSLVFVPLLLHHQAGRDPDCCLTLKHGILDITALSILIEVIGLLPTLLEAPPETLPEFAKAPQLVCHGVHLFPRWLRRLEAKLHFLAIFTAKVN